MKYVAKTFVLALGLVAVGAGRSQASAITFQASGANAGALQVTVDAFRTALGTLNPNVIGSFGSGRREINWDGVPDALSAPNNLPANFFNVNSPRGAVFATPGTGFQVSANAGIPGTGIEFENLAAGNSALFATFSPQRLFTALGSTITDVTFFIPGTTSPAVTRAFGAVFTDVDLASTTSLQFFDPLGNSLGTFFVPAATGNETLSFLGVQFTTELVGRVRITSGSAADSVVMDDFIYSEPVPAPEPATLLLMGTGLGLIAKRVRSRRQSA